MFYQHVKLFVVECLAYAACELDVVSGRVINIEPYSKSLGSARWYADRHQ